MSRISEEQVKHVAHLARLAVTEEEAQNFTKHLDAIIGYAELLNELDTDNVEPTTHVLDIKNVLRKDESRQWLSQDEALKNAPDKKDGQFRVPSIIE
ncbi:Asp-tRNA(Asn)/Glu-tRNA(Gln) amidotransferase subunit GatC [Bacillus sp. Marseille-P3661]|uniref:Asp-tRNA(Asn)/Glu-tRNA(Gln) amidotransferase subunit GatC n=1 Tax=Bacillus sp. Marseille-P3661 TaxID=1936234 RepID=UPI000C8304FA|nr:Asp-tRNA(Asn)/Glu-tRNA(Gln) amidotransferase subunit GatC [Bacillus sp. Marseille-P3661]